MEINKDLVADAVAENVEQTTEKTAEEKKYTQEEVDAIVGNAKARTKAKITKEYDRKYDGLTNVLKAGTGIESVEEMTDAFREHYESKGVRINKPSEYSQKDIDILARADAEDIIRSGPDEVEEEIKRLAAMDVDKLSARDKKMLGILEEHKRNAEKTDELAKLGVPKEVYDSQAFKDFEKKFVSGTPITDIYNIYKQTTQPKKEFKTMGSMKNSAGSEGAVKDFYTYEEAMRFTQEDLDKNPALYKAIKASMPKW